MPSIENLVSFAHGKESGPWGVKITHLAEVARRRGFAVDSPDYSHTQDPHARVAHLLKLKPKARRLVLVGSSMGGYVVAQAAATLKPQALFLMAPALYFPGFDEEPAWHPPLTVVVQGWRDDIVQVERILRYAQPRQVVLHVLNSGHDLNDQLEMLAMLFDHLLVRVLTQG